MPVSLYHYQHAFALSSTNDTYYYAICSCYTLTSYFRYTRPPASSSSLVHSYVIYIHTCLSLYITNWLSTFIIIYIYIYIYIFRLSITLRIPWLHSLTPTYRHESDVSSPKRLLRTSIADKAYSTLLYIIFTIHLFHFFLIVIWHYDGIPRHPILSRSIWLSIHIPLPTHITKSNIRYAWYILTIHAYNRAIT